MSPHFWNSTNGKGHLRKTATSVVFCKRKPANFRMFAANGTRKRTLVFMKIDFFWVGMTKKGIKLDFWMFNILKNNFPETL
jgi:uncharacterized protein YjaG (DUF416 family)